jgi:glycosyltransferase involved in cell wall biosynthesis
MADVGRRGGAILRGGQRSWRLARAGNRTLKGGKVPAPAISVVLPVRNGQAFLDEAIRSIRAQSFGDFEFIVVDDGSDDATAEIARRHAADDPRIRIIAQAPAGIVAALNRGIETASAPLIARMDADDVAMPRRLERQMEALSRYPAAAVIGSSFVVIDRAGRDLRTVRVPTGSKEICERLERNNCIAHPTVVMRRDAVLGIGGYRRAFRQCEDYDLWLRLAERYEILNIDEPLLRYREHAGQLTWGNVEQRILSELAARLSARRRRAGEADPAEGVDRIARHHLRAFGLGDAEIANFIVGRALDAAQEARQAGNPRAAWSAYGLARRQQPLTGPIAAPFWRACAGAMF